jgi:eukaryotic-like serine/threonine-protein kinase
MVGKDTTGLPLASRSSPAAVDEPRATGPLTAGQSFGPRYHILRLLGIGGMGAVYQAWDAELSVAVALKVIRPEVTADPEAAHELERRFKQELLLARQVTHKNVVRIHDLGEINGIKYISMPYIEGSDLASALKRFGKINVPIALSIARQIAAGLQAAHEAGVVHRDLKPANIMVEGTHALITDFGIARSTLRVGAVSAPLAAAPRTDVSGLTAAVTVAAATMAGSVVGTVEFMAPEQAKALAVDHRADIYAFGLILYDMLLGPRRHFGALNAIAELQARMEQPPPSMRSIDAEIPEALDRIVSRCVEPNAAARFQTTAELVAAFDALDDQGVPLPPVRRLTRPMVAATAAIVVAMLGGTYFVTRLAVEPAVQHDPVSVLIADVENQTGDPAFDRALEPVLKIALEGSGFITAFDRSGVGNIGSTPVERLDEQTALQIAVKQGVGVVISGVLTREGNSYAISAKATQPVTGTVIATASGRASGHDRVLAAATNVAASVRTALGDETEDSASQIFAMDTLSATNLEVVRQYAAATEAAARARHEDALKAFFKSVQLDPTFGMGYQGMAIASRNLGRQEDAEKYIQEALRHIDRMTERERFRARGFFYRVTGDYQACVKEYGDLIGRYAADVAAHNQIALCSTYLRDWPRAIDEMRRLVKILPQTTLFRNNLAVYQAYLGSFDAAEQEARAIANPGVNSFVALAFGQLGQGRVTPAIETYQKLQTMTTLGAAGASRAISGLGDVAIYEGRFTDAVRILGEGAASDLAAKETNRAATKFTALAYAQLARRQNAAAIAAANSALKNSRSVKIRFLAARTLAEAGDLTTAQSVAASLASDPQPEPQAHAKIAEGVILLKRGDVPQAVKVLTEANAMLETWIGHFELGRAHLEAGQLIQADSEFDRCFKRRGEALALFLDEEPTYGYLPALYYYQGRVREALKSAGFAESYRTYLDIRGKSSEDPLVAEVRRRAGG